VNPALGVADPAAHDASPLVTMIPVALLRTSLERLRSVQPQRLQPRLQDLPIRVVADDGGFFEIVDGFKRFALWRDEGRTLVPAVVESARSSAEQKLLLLRSNAPPRTTTPMDEARVIRSLVEEDGLGLAGVARLLNRRKPWVSRRLALATRLSPVIERKVDQGAIGPTLAYALCALSDRAQEDVVKSIEHHSLGQSEALTLVAAWRACSSESDKAGLLSNPMPVVTH
jgi:ParB-like chromosome segregation protein Spo0J